MNDEGHPQRHVQLLPSNDRPRKKIHVHAKNFTNRSSCEVSPQPLGGSTASVITTNQHMSLPSGTSRGTCTSKTSATLMACPSDVKTFGRVVFGLSATTCLQTSYPPIGHSARADMKSKASFLSLDIPRLAREQMMEAER
jgi:hypothetical protein